MIYLDTSVLLAHLLAEDRSPPGSLWEAPLVSSRLLEYEAFTRIHAAGLGDSHADDLREGLSRVSFVELSPVVLERALEPFPVPVRTLDAIHLATLVYLTRQRLQPSLASFDARQIEAARALDVEVIEI